MITTRGAYKQEKLIHISVLQEAHIPNMSSHDFEVKCLVSFGDGRPPVERAYNKTVATGKNTATYRCVNCGGRFTHDSSKMSSFEDWRDKKISRCPQGSKSANSSKKSKSNRKQKKKK